MSEVGGMSNICGSSTLPIHECRNAILEGILNGGRVLLSAPTGSGKSTQVPQFLSDDLLASDKVVYVTQPRRVAARALARRVANECGTQLGDGVGYEMRFARCVTKKTRIIYLTEGVLLRKLLGGGNLTEAGAVMLDEFHERTVNADLCLALIKRLQDKLRPDLKLVVSSATLNPKPLLDYLPGSTVVESDGRTFPVRIEHITGNCSPEAPIWDRVCKQLGRLASQEPTGDFLVFLSGAYEIRRTIEALQRFPASKGMRLLPLHGELSAEAQDAALAPSEKRKVVVATNVAETSLTIDGVRLVIDSGLAKKAGHDPRRGVNTLFTEKISQASATQRAGRAGRTSPGVCIRMWSDSDHARRTAEEVPEIHRVDLSETILALMASGHDSRNFPWFDAPGEENLERAEVLLKGLGALDGDSREITSLGRLLATLPAHPRHARVIHEARENGCPQTAALAIALTQTRSILLSAKEKSADELTGPDEIRSDFIPPIRAWELAAERNYDLGFCRAWGIHAGRAREAGKIRDQFLRGMSLEGGNIENWSPEHLARALLAGYPEQVARRTRTGSSVYALAGGGHGELRRGSEAKGGELVVVAEVEEIAVKGKACLILELATEIREDWLAEIFPGRFIDHQETTFDPESRSVVARRTRRFGKLVFDEQALGEPDPAKAAGLLAEEIIVGRLKLKQWNAEVEHWIERVNFVASHCPEIEIATLDESGRKAICEQICLGFRSYRQIKNKEVFSFVKDWLSEEQIGAVEKLAPEEYRLPNRRKPTRIRYASGEATIAAKIQELYDLKEAPVIASGRYVVCVEALAPNGRPVQVTRDMESFWRDSYPEIRKQLAGRYPKHEWR